MKVLVLVSCLAFASGQWAPAYHGSQAPAGYHGPHHVPVIKDGVPVETPEVQHAKAAHLAALAEASSRPGYQQHDDSQNYEQPQYNQQYSQPQYSQPQYQQQQQYSGYSGAQHGFSYNNQHQPQAYSAAPVHAAPQHRAIAQAYETSHAYPGITNEGKPLDTPEVEAAKAHHFALVNEALARNAPKGGYQAEPTYSQGGYNAPHYRKRRGLYTQHIPIIHNGVPVEPFEVQKAREAHLAAHYGAGHHGYSTHQVHAPVYGHHDAYAHFVPSYGHDGHPLDTPEVEHAKAAHFAAHHEAAARNHVAPVVGHYAHAYAHDGAPVDTPEVQHAKALHFAAHAAASHAHHY